MRIAGMRRMFAVLCAGAALLYAAGCGMDLRIDVQEDDGGGGGPNRPPIAFAGMDQSVLVGALVTLDASGSSDLDGDLISYSWALWSTPPGSLASLTGPDTVYPTFIADMRGTYTFLLTVSDGAASSVDSVNVTAAVANAAPVANAGPDQTVVTGTTVVLDGTGSSDPENASLSYLWTFVSVPMGSTTFLLSESTDAPSFLADMVGEYVIELVVSDGYATSAPDTISVTAGDQAPPVADAGPDQTAVSSGTVVTLDGSGSYDPNTEPITYDWFFVSYPTAASPVLDDPTLVDPSFTANVAGDYVIGLIVNDGTSDSAQDNVVVTASGGSFFYRDADVDGFGNPASSVQAADAPDGYVTDGTDCDDTPITGAAINPGATEQCDDVDNNCDPSDDLILRTYYTDADSDTYGDDATAVTPPDCVQPADTITRGGDCDDGNVAVNPEANDVCNGIDDDCDGVADQGYNLGVACTEGVGECADSGVTICAVDGDSVVCDATPGSSSVEICNGLDDDCDGTIDNGFATSTFFADGDGDGYGNPGLTVEACAAPQNYVDDGTDCDDTDVDVHPNAAERCNGVDDDCDGSEDEDFVLGEACTAGVGACEASGVTVCAADGLSAVCGAVPGSPTTEICNSIDDDCDGTVDNGSTYYHDGDGDTFGDPNDSLDYCEQPAFYVLNSGDCNDGDEFIYPSAPELCNDKDDDCDSLVDEDFSLGEPCTSGFGICAAAGVTICSEDLMSAVCDAVPSNPAPSEICDNSLDDDCDGSVDEGCPP